jgi:hypothetical protein
MEETLHDPIFGVVVGHIVMLGKRRFSTCHQVNLCTCTNSSKWVLTLGMRKVLPFRYLANFLLKGVKHLSGT